MTDLLREEVEALRARASNLRGKARANAVIDGPEEKYAEYLIRSEESDLAATRLASLADRLDEQPRPDEGGAVEALTAEGFWITVEIKAPNAYRVTLDGADTEDWPVFWGETLDEALRLASEHAHPSPEQPEGEARCPTCGSDDPGVRLTAPTNPFHPCGNYPWHTEGKEA